MNQALWELNLNTSIEFVGEKWHSGNKFLMFVTSYVQSWTNSNVKNLSLII